MKRALLSLAVAMSVNVWAQDLESDAQRFGYAVGVDVAQNVFEFNADGQELIDLDAFIQAVRDVHAGGELKMSDEELAKAFEDLTETLQATMLERAEELFREAEEESKAFLEANAKEEGVVVTDSGLQYLVLEEGEGDSPTADDRVSVLYEGRLVDGTVFDAADEEPIRFGVSEVIEGWQEGLQLMKEGAKYRFFIPADLAYGEYGQMAAGILPGSALIFDVELVGIEK